MTHHEFGSMPDIPLTVETEAKFMGLINRIQKDLIRDYMTERGVTGDSSSPEGIEVTQEWAAKYSGKNGKFRKIFHRMMIANPHLKEDLEAIPDALYEQIKEELYHEDGKVNPDEYLEIGQDEDRIAA